MRLIWRSTEHHNLKEQTGNEFIKITNAQDII